jgi:hypothetical protein
MPRDSVVDLLFTKALDRMLIMCTGANGKTTTRRSASLGGGSEHFQNFCRVVAPSLDSSSISDLVLPNESRVRSQGPYVTLWRRTFLSPPLPRHFFADISVKQRYTKMPSSLDNGKGEYDTS